MKKKKAFFIIGVLAIFLIVVVVIVTALKADMAPAVNATLEPLQTVAFSQT